MMFHHGLRQTLVVSSRCENDGFVAHTVGATDVGTFSGGLVGPAHLGNPCRYTLP